MSASLRENSVELTGEGVCQLFRLMLRSGSGNIHFTADGTSTWQGMTFEAVACQLSGVASYADEQSARPRMTVQNPDGAFTGVVAQGALENAKLTRWRVLRRHAELDVNISTMQTWRVARVLSLNRFLFSVELRSMDDRANYTIPAQTFSAPDFPTVTLR